MKEAATPRVFEGASVEEVLKQAAAAFGVEPDRLGHKVLEEEKAFFGLFGRKLRVECWVKERTAAEKALTHLNRLAALMDFDLSAEPTEERKLNLSGADSFRLTLDGARTLKSLEYLVNLLNRGEEFTPRVGLDCDGFRAKRESELEQIAIDAAKEAMRSKRTVYLPPMENWERRLVHIALRESLVVETHSRGLEPHRRVAIRLKGQGASDWSDEERRLNARRSSWGRSGDRRPGSGRGRPRQGRPSGRRFSNRRSDRD